QDGQEISVTLDGDDRAAAREQLVSERPQASADLEHTLAAGGCGQLGDALGVPQLAQEILAEGVFGTQSTALEERFGTRKLGPRRHLSWPVRWCPSETRRSSNPRDRRAVPRGQAGWWAAADRRRVRAEPRPSALLLRGAGAPPRTRSRRAPT